MSSTNEMFTRQIAMLCHEVNKAICESQGDLSQTNWNDAPEWQKQSAIDGVNYHLQNPDAGPSGSHENWLKFKLADGWKYGSIKDPDLKEHPCIVPYNDLPYEQRVKDYVFRSIVHKASEIFY